MITVPITISLSLKIQYFSPFAPLHKHPTYQAQNTASKFLCKFIKKFIVQNSILDKRFSFESSDNISSAITEIHHQQFRLCWAANCRLFESKPVVNKKIVSISILWRIDFAIYAFNYSIKLGTVNFACMQSY